MGASELREPRSASFVVAAGGTLWFVASIVTADRDIWPYAAALGLILIGLRSLEGLTGPARGWRIGAGLTLIVLGFASLLPPFSLLTAFVVIPAVLSIGPIAVPVYGFVIARRVVRSRTPALLAVALVVVAVCLLPTFGLGYKEQGLVLFAVYGVLWATFGIALSMTLQAKAPQV